MTDKIALSSPDPARAPETVIGEAEIESLIEQANQASSESRTFMEPAASAPKRGRGRPKKEAPPKQEEGPKAEEPKVDFSGLFIPVFQVGSAMLVRATGVPEVALVPQEITGLSVAWGAVAAKYAPAFLAQHGELIVAIGTTLSVGARINATLKEAIELRKKQMEAERAATIDAEGKTL